MQAWLVRVPYQQHRRNLAPDVSAKHLSKQDHNTRTRPQSQSQSQSPLPQAKQDGATRAAEPLLRSLLIGCPCCFDSGVQGGGIVDRSSAIRPGLSPIKYRTSATVYEAILKISVEDFLSIVKQIFPHAQPDPSTQDILLLRSRCDQALGGLPKRDAEQRASETTQQKDEQYFGSQDRPGSVRNYI